MQPNKHPPQAKAFEDLIHSTKKNQAYQEFPDCFRIATLAGFKST
jgi:hypothetical protein